MTFSNPATDSADDNSELTDSPRGAVEDQKNTGWNKEASTLLLNPFIAEKLGARTDILQLRIGYVPGVMPGKWFTRWHDRYDSLRQLVEIPLDHGMALEALNTSLDAEESQPTPLTEPHSAVAHMVLLRPHQEPRSLDKENFHSITLYAEKQVVIFPRDHFLSALEEEEVPLEELKEEWMLQEPETIPEWAEVSAEYRLAHPRTLPEMRNLQDAVELVAAGLGLLIVPMSLARFYHRKDLTYRVVSGLPDLPVNLVWKREHRDDVDEQIIQDFVGVCRGRTPGSDRGSESAQVRREKRVQEKELEKRKRRAANAQRESRDRKVRNAKKNGTYRASVAKASVGAKKKTGKTAGTQGGTGGRSRAKKR